MDRRQSTWLPRLLGIGALLFAACTGVIEDPANSRPGSGTNQQPLDCADPERPAPLSNTPRLTRREYVEVLRALFGDEVMTAVASSIELVPRDRTTREFDTQNQSITREHVKAYLLVAEAIGKHFEENAAARAALVPCLEQSGDLAACVQSFVIDFGARAFRRALDASEVERYQQVFEIASSASPASGLREVLGQLLQAPDFIFKLELRGTEVAARENELRLNGDELATRLSFALWGQPPDAELAERGRSGALLDAQELAAQVERLLVAPRARVHLREFFTQWLLLDQLPDIEAPPEWAQGSTDVAGLNAAMVSEVERLTEWVIFEQRGSFADLLTTNVTLLDSPSLAAVYGVEMPSDPSVPVTLPDDRRGGLLGRLAFVANPEAVSHPILRGARIRTQILCGTLKQPDPDSLPEGTFEDPPLDPTMTTRERFAAKTAAPECSGCHQQINPLGFALEAIDGLGRLRDTEQVFSEDGKLLGELSVNATVDPLIDGEPGGNVNGAAELGKRIAESPSASSCMAEQWYRFSARPAGEDAACVLADLATALDPNQGGSILEMLRRWVTSREFSHRRFDPNQESP